MVQVPPTMGVRERGPRLSAESVRAIESPGWPRPANPDQLLAAPLELDMAICAGKENKAGYTATLVKCGWAGAVLEKVTRASGLCSDGS